VTVNLKHLRRGDLLGFNRSEGCGPAFINAVQAVEAVVTNTVALLTANTVPHFTLTSIAVHHFAIAVKPTAQSVVARLFTSDRSAKPNFSHSDC
jgi:hypothetical protein